MNFGFITRENDLSFEDAVERLRNKYKEHHFFSSNSEEKESVLKKADALIVTDLSEEEAMLSERLEVVFVPFVGINSLPVRYLARKGIVVSNTHWNSKYVAEKAVGLSLALLGRTVEFHSLLERGIWGGFLASEKEYQNWTSLYNKKCTILGYGSIGRDLARLLKAFDCEITAFKRNVAQFEDAHVDFVTDDLEKAVEFGEVLFFTLPLTQQTRYLINEGNMDLLRNKYVINVGRGKLIREEPFYQALKNGVIKGAAIDVWYNYPKDEKITLPFNYPFHMLSNVVLSPHTASDAYEGITDWVETTVARVERYIQTQEILNRVDLERGY